MIGRIFIFHIEIGRRCQISFIGGCCCNGSCIHQRHRGNLTVLKLGSFSVREVSCRMTDTERIICRSIPRAKARSAECCLNNRSCRKEICDSTVFHQFHVNRSTCRIHTECKGIGADVLPADNVRRGTDILKSASGTSCNDSLLHVEFSVSYFILQ